MFHFVLILSSYLSLYLALLSFKQSFTLMFSIQFTHQLSFSPSVSLYTHLPIKLSRKKIHTHTHPFHTEISISLFHDFFSLNVQKIQISQTGVLFSKNLLSTHLSEWQKGVNHPAAELIKISGSSRLHCSYL